MNGAVQGVAVTTASRPVKNPPGRAGCAMLNGRATSKTPARFSPTAKITQAISATTEGD
jgi:hypothetical protein